MNRTEAVRGTLRNRREPCEGSRPVPPPAFRPSPHGSHTSPRRCPRFHTVSRGSRTFSHNASHGSPHGSIAVCPAVALPSSQPPPTPSSTRFLTLPKVAPPRAPEPRTVLEKCPQESLTRFPRGPPTPFHALLTAPRSASQLSTCTLGFSHGSSRVRHTVLPWFPTKLRTQVRAPLFTVPSHASTRSHTLFPGIPHTASSPHTFSRAPAHLRVPFPHGSL